MNIWCGEHQSLWGKWGEVCFRAGMAVFYQGPWTCFSVSWCWRLPATVPLWGLKSPHAFAAEPFTFMKGGLMSAGKFLAWEPELWRLLQNTDFWFTSATSSLATVLRPKAVRALGCPCASGFGLTLCMGRELDHVPKQWGYPGRPSCWWQQTNTSHYIFPFSEGYSFSS